MLINAHQTQLIAKTGSLDGGDNELCKGNDETIPVQEFIERARRIGAKAERPEKSI